MSFLRLSDPLLSVLFEDEDIIAIDKCYGFNAHTNDSKIEHSEFIQDGLIEIFEKQRGQKLHIIHRLDQTTTGVMIFGKSVESAKKYAAYFFDRQVKKTYWFITQKPKTATSEVKESFTIDQQIIHKGKELEASTDFIFKKKAGSLELWEAHPHTGRNHQIRIHAQAAGLSLLGDIKYGGQPFGFLSLHNCKMQFPNGITIESRPPIYFENLALLEDLVLTKAFFHSDRRQRLFAGAQASESYRLVHNINQSNDPGFTLDHFGETLFLDWQRDFWGDVEDKKFNFLAKTLQQSLVVQRSTTAKTENHWICRENQVSYEIRNGQGLPLNQRLQRRWVLENSKDKSVLNLFSQSGSFAVNAALGKASQVVQVDSNKNSLNWSRKNFEINQAQSENFKFLCRDSLPFVEQSQAKGTKFDLIICEAPSFVRGEKSVFKIGDDLERLITACLQSLNEDGTFLFSTAFEGLFIRDVQQAFQTVKKKLQIKNLEIHCVLPGLDFELADERVSLKSFLVRKSSDKLT